jgi:peptidylprolyl isomerase
MNKSFLFRFFKKEVLFLPCLVFLIAATDDPVIAQRGDDQITVSQARALIAGTDGATQHRLTTDPSALKQVLRDVLLQRAILREAQAEKWEQRPDIAALLQKARDQVIAQSFLGGHAPLPAGYPTDADIEAAYKANMQRFMQPRGYHLVQVFLPRTAYATPEDGRKRLLPVRAQVQRGHGSLETAAKAVSGARYMDMGWAPESQLVPAVKDAVAGLPEGAMADPLCIENGCHLIRLVATRPAGPAPLADVRDELIKALRQRKQAQEETEYASGLLTKQPVEVNEIQLSRIAP